ncbi:HOG (high osmolarity glycerol) pathway protein [Podila horticola]|nr:HOG (high osmolarity glycerol) pathway protein [Podila horticola]
MDMAPVSLPLYLGSGNETTNPVDLKARKRVSVHIPQDVETPRRLSLTFNSARCRSLSESWALSSPVSTNSTGFTALLLSSTSSSSLMTPPPSLPSSPLSSLYQTTPLSPMSNDDASTKGGISQEQEKEQEQVQDQDQDLLKSLASFLQKQNQTQVELPGAPSTTLASASAGPIDTNNSDLVVRVRDFAYPKTHPYHLGHFPPPPACEESDVEEDDEPMEWYTEKREEEDHSHFFQDEEEPLDRTHGQARGLYDFDAETDTELSFREGEYLWIHSRQFPGWFLGEIAGVTGLVPENYVQIL